MTTRTNTQCPACRFHTAVHFAASDKPGKAWYHCVRIHPSRRGVGKRARACGEYFEAPAPVPLRTRDIPEHPVDAEWEVAA